MREEPLQGKILEDGDVYLSNDEGSRWNGRFIHDGDQLLFGNARSLHLENGVLQIP
jgi:hypothetical protein